MKTVYTNNLVPGMVLAADIYNYNGQSVMRTGRVLDDQAISKLIFYAIPFVKVEEDKLAKEEEKKTAVSYAKRIQDSREYGKFKERFEADIQEMKDVFVKIVNQSASIAIGNRLIQDIMDLICSTRDQTQLFDFIQNMRSYKDLIYAHSINVGMISYIFSGWLGMGDADRRLALECGLFHDIGKLMIPDAIIHKSTKLTKEEYDLMKNHTVEGYKIMQAHPVNEHMKNAILMHHERNDGSGYPLAIKGQEIDRFARLVAIADVYEATTAPRKYRGALCPFTVISIFENEGLQKYDTKMIMIFLENIGNTYLQNRVRLSDGREGEIAFINQHLFSRPVVNCGGECIDLSQCRDLSIQEII